MTTNTECNRIADALASAASGDAWYGDSLRKIVADTTAAEAVARPIANGHSIWELVRHVEAWARFALAAVGGVPIPAWETMTKEQDWPSSADVTEEDWNEAVRSLLSTHSQLIEALRTLDDIRLDEPVPGRAYNFYRLFHGMIQHAAYHAGQIALLRKAISQRPECPA